MRTGSIASTKIIGIAEVVCLTASAAFPPVTMTSTLAGRTLTRLLRIVRCVLLPSVSISASHALTASLRARSAARAGGRPRLCHPRGRRHRHRYDARSGRQAIPGVLPGRCFHHPQIRRHRSWARDQQTLLPDDGRRHHGRERTRPRIDLHGPSTEDCGCSEGSDGCQSDSHGRSGLESSLGVFASSAKSPFALAIKISFGCIRDFRVKM